MSGRVQLQGQGPCRQGGPRRQAHRLREELRRLLVIRAIDVPEPREVARPGLRREVRIDRIHGPPAVGPGERQAQLPADHGGDLAGKLQEPGHGAWQDFRERAPPRPVEDEEPNDQFFILSRFVRAGDQIIDVESPLIVGEPIQPGETQVQLGERNVPVRDAAHPPVDRQQTGDHFGEGRAHPGALPRCREILEPEDGERRARAGRQQTVGRLREDGEIAGSAPQEPRRESESHQKQERDPEDEMKEARGRRARLRTDREVDQGGDLDLGRHGAPGRCAGAARGAEARGDLLQLPPHLGGRAGAHLRWSSPGAGRSTARAARGSPD